MINYGFIGIGTIGKMMIKRFTDVGVIKPENQIRTSNESKNNREVITNSDMVYLCVRPQKLNEVYPDLKGSLEGKCLITTVGAVESASYYRNIGQVELIRIMPSVTNNVGGALLLSAGEWVRQATKEKVYEDVSRIAKVYEVPEQLLDKYTHLASCFPAIIAEFVSSYIDALQGIDKEIGKEIAVETLDGTAALLKRVGFEIVDRVCTKGGITREGINFVAEKFPIDELAKCLLERMEAVKNLYGK